MLQQGGVVDVGDLALGKSQAAGELGGQQAGVERRARGLSHAKVGHLGERAEWLGEAEIGHDGRPLVEWCGTPAGRYGPERETRYVRGASLRSGAASMWHAR